MTDMTVKTPWHLWVVGGLSLLWNAFGGYDFIMTTTQGEAYWRAAGHSPEMIDYFHGMPIWLYVPWTLGVWGGVIGSILILLRNRLATPIFGLSLLGVVVTSVYQKLINPMPPLPPEMAVMGYIAWAILVIAAFLLWYAWTMSKKGVLR